MNLKNILLILVVISVVLTGALLTGSQFGQTKNPTTITAEEKTKACPTTYDEACCTEKIEDNKCPADYKKPCCTVEENGNKCPTDCTKPCCAEKNTPPVVEEVPLCCG